MKMTPREMREMPLPVVDRGPDLYRHRARELIAFAWREDNQDRRRYLFELSKTYQRAADALAPAAPSDNPGYAD